MDAWHCLTMTPSVKLACELLLAYAVMVQGTSACPSLGATPELRALLSGRCLQYSTFVNPEALCNKTDPLNCSAAADVFVSAFAFQDVCNVSSSRYDKFLAATDHVIPADKSLFWEGVYDFVHKYSQGGQRLVTLEDTLTGYMIDRLRFCAAPGETGGIGGPSTQLCPSFDETEGCLWNAEFAFWVSASQNFASRARGAIWIMLNASTPRAFPPDSFFGLWELPNLKAGEVTNATILLVHSPGQEIKESCQGPSIENLMTRLAGKNITTTCRDDPREVVWLLCWDSPSEKECMDLLGGDMGQSGVRDMRGVSGVTAVALAGCLVYMRLAL